LYVDFLTGPDDFFVVYPNSDVNAVATHLMKRQVANCVPVVDDGLVPSRFKTIGEAITTVVTLTNSEGNDAVLLEELKKYLPDLEVMIPTTPDEIAAKVQVVTIIKDAISGVKDVATARGELSAVKPPEPVKPPVDDAGNPIVDGAGGVPVDESGRPIGDGTPPPRIVL
jgi:hypothetical protein